MSNEELVKRLHSIVESEDHLRGCGGRCYECGNSYIEGVICDYDKRKDELIIEAAQALTLANGRVEKAQNQQVSAVDKMLAAENNLAIAKLDLALANGRVEKARGDTLEEAAKVAEDDDGHFNVWGEDRNTRVAQQTCKDIAAAIRALKSTPAKE